MVGRSLVSYDIETNQLTLTGDWNLYSLVAIKKALANISLSAKSSVTIDGSNVTRMDSAAAWELSSFLTKVKQSGLEVKSVNFSSEQEKLMTLVAEKIKLPNALPLAKSISLLAAFGKASYVLLSETYAYLSFVGYLSLECLRVIASPKRIRFNALANVVFSTGFQALSIIALLSVMIGVVITYQMGLQLKTYGANVYIVDLLGLSILREFGPLITAIMIAGRTGSAFTAQLGMMKINQEIDALNTMGVTSAELLILPRIFGLLISLPLLTVWADIFGVLGGMLMANNMLHISSADFLHRFPSVIPLKSLLIGVGKAPVFALIIATVGCFHGMTVVSNADSVGRNTTRSVVHSIFLIIIADALFSVIFSKLHL